MKFREIKAEDCSLKPREREKESGRQPEKKRDSERNKHREREKEREKWGKMGTLADALSTGLATEIFLI